LAKEIIEDRRVGMSAYFDRAETALGATQVTAKSPKLLALEALGQQIEPGEPKERRAKIAVSVAAGNNHQGVFQQACIGCGDCFTGCNHGAKNTLPVNYLACAHQNGVRLFTGVTSCASSKVPVCGAAPRRHRQEAAERVARSAHRRRRAENA
jgi:ferredoxin